MKATKGERAGQEHASGDAPGLDRALEALTAARDTADPQQLAVALSIAETALRAARTSSSPERDGLTGLPSRAAFAAELERLLAQVRRHGRVASLVVLDLDGLAQVNLAAGRPAGDRLLTSASALVAGRVRVEDGLGRLGDDELGLLLVESDAAAAAEVADALRAQIAALASAAGTPLTVSAAVVALTADVGDPDAALLAAEMGLHAAKAAGRDRTEIVSAGGLQPLGGNAGGPDDRDGRLLVELGELARTPTIDGALESVRDLLGMDISYVTRHTAQEQIFVRLRGDGSSFGVGEDTRLPLDQTFCQAILEGRLPHLMTDTQEHEAALALPVTEAAGVGSYASVPVLLSDGRLYGTLCCADHERSPQLGERDLRFMRVLARMVAHEIERDAYVRAQHELRVQAAGADALVHAVEARDAYTGEHSRLVVDLATRVATRLGLGEREVAEVAQVALLHDIGKIAVPDSVLNKPGPLEADELVEMRRHPEHGERLVAGVAELAHLSGSIRAEHERFDGSGYPDGLRGDAIPIASRITLACDAFHAMTSDRPYRPAMSRADAVRELTANAGTQFCPACVQALLAVLASRSA